MGAEAQTDAEKLRWQFDLENNPIKRIEFAAGLISQKLEASRNTLLANFPTSEILEKAISKVGECKCRITAGQPQTMDELLSTEGTAAQAYFAAWRGLGLRWKTGSANRLPESWLFYDSRSSVLSGKKWKNWRASNPINAMLNYGYAILEADTRIEVVSEGYDPRIGILHIGRTREKEDSFVFDIMEPLRPVVDGAILAFVGRHTFSAADFVVRSDGVCRLSPQLAKAVVECVQQPLRLNVIGFQGASDPPAGAVYAIAGSRSSWANRPNRLMGGTEDE